MAADPTASIRRAEQRCYEMAKRVLDPRPALARVAVQVEQMPRDAIMRQQSPSGARWKPLALSTLMQRKHGQSELALMRTGELFASFKCRVAPANNGVLLSCLGRVLFHQGSTRPWLPSKRNPLPLEKVGGRWMPIRQVYDLMRRELGAYIRGVSPSSNPQGGRRAA